MMSCTYYTHYYHVLINIQILFITTVRIIIIEIASIAVVSITTLGTSVHRPKTAWEQYNSHQQQGCRMCH